MKKCVRFGFRAALLLHHLILALILGCETLFKIGEIENDELRQKTKVFWATLTCWNITIQCVYLAVALLNDVLKIVEKPNSKLVLVQGYFYTTLVVPFTIETSVLFWSAYFVNYELILPQELVKLVFPFWRMFCLHANNLLLLIELYTTKIEVPKFKQAFLGANVAIIAYIITWYVSYVLSGTWLYNIFEKINWAERMFYTIFVYLFQIALFYLSYHQIKQKRIKML